MRKFTYASKSNGNYSDFYGDTLNQHGDVVTISTFDGLLSRITTVIHLAPGDYILEVINIEKQED